MLIGITGKARSGKDTFAEMLAESLFDKLQRKYIMMAYATELKLRVQRDFDLSYEQLWGDQKEVEDNRYPKKDGGFWTAREILQFMGTECFRAVDDNFWIRTLFEVIEDKEYENVIVTDVRFPNEADPIKDRDGYVIKVIREDKDEIHGSQHASETAMDNYNADFTVVNEQGLDELKATANGVAEFLIQNEKLKKNLEV